MPYLYWLFVKGESVCIRGQVRGTPRLQLISQAWDNDILGIKIVIWMFGLLPPEVLYCKVLDNLKKWWCVRPSNHTFVFAKEIKRSIMNDFNGWCLSVLLRFTSISNISHHLFWFGNKSHKDVVAREASNSSKWHVWAGHLLNRIPLQLVKRL
mgnify:CR=1 FL=1